MANTVVVPHALYKHFKGSLYYVNGVSLPVQTIRESECDEINTTVLHTEKDKYITIYKIHGCYFHKQSEASERLVFYERFNAASKCYARPIDMFVSEVDHEKYPDVKQKYRFALEMRP